MLKSDLPQGKFEFSCWEHQAWVDVVVKRMNALFWSRTHTCGPRNLWLLAEKI
jgi:hypothetical protein